MVVLRRSSRALAGTVLLAVLTACGGGGGSPGTPGGGGINGGGGGGGGSGAVVDKYIGTWVRCVATTATDSQRETLALNKSSDTSMVYSDTLVDFANSTSCAGTGVNQPTTTGTVSWVGTKSIGGETVDEIEIQPTGAPSVTRQVAEIRSDAKLYFGFLSGSVDANGYPNTIDPNGFSKQ